MADTVYDEPWTVKLRHHLAPGTKNRMICIFGRYTNTQINRCYHGLSCPYRGAGAKTSTAHYNEGRPKSHCFEKKVSTVRDMDIKLDDGNMKPVCLSLGFILEVSAGHTCVLSCSQSSSLLLPQFMPLLTSLLTD